MAKLYKLFLFLFLLTNSTFAQSDVKYVSPSGSDSNDGSLNSPYKTIAKALSTLNTGTIKLLDGIYTEKVIIENKNNIIISGDHSGNVIIDGTISLNEFNWTETENNIFKTTIDTAIWQLFIEDLKKVEYHVNEIIDNIYARGQKEDFKKDIEEIEMFFSYWKRHAKFEKKM